MLSNKSTSAFFLSLIGWPYLTLLIIIFHYDNLRIWDENTVEGMITSATMPHSIFHSVIFKIPLFIISSIAIFLAIKNFNYNKNMNGIAIILAMILFILSVMPLGDLFRI